MLAYEIVQAGLEVKEEKSKKSRKLLPNNVLIESLKQWFDQNSCQLPTRGSDIFFGPSRIKKGQLWYFADTLESKLEKGKIEPEFIGHSVILIDQIKAIRIYEEKEQQRQIETELNNFTEERKPSNCVLTSKGEYYTPKRLAEEVNHCVKYSGMKYLYCKYPDLFYFILNNLNLEEMTCELDLNVLNWFKKEKKKEENIKILKPAKIDEENTLVKDIYTSNQNSWEKDKILQIENLIDFKNSKKGFSGMKISHPELYAFAINSIDNEGLFAQFSEYCQKSIETVCKDNKQEYIPKRWPNRNVVNSDVAKTKLAIEFMKSENSRPKSGSSLSNFLEKIFKPSAQIRFNEFKYNIGQELFQELEYRYFETSNEFTHYLNTIRCLRIMEETKQRPFLFEKINKWLKRTFENSDQGKKKYINLKKTIGNEKFSELEYWFKYTSPEKI
jgi:hypothetical protein